MPSGYQYLTITVCKVPAEWSISPRVSYLSHNSFVKPCGYVH